MSKNVEIRFERIEVLDAMECVLQSPSFPASAQLKSFLRYIVNKKLDGEEGKIKAYSVAIDVFGRADTFDPQTDPIVRVIAGKLRNALKVYYLDEGVDVSIRIDVPTGSYRPNFSRSIFPSSKLPKQSNVLPLVQRQPPSRNLWWPTPVVIFTVTAIIAAMFYFEPFRFSEKAVMPSAPIIAVAEFQNMSGDEKMDNFLSGLKFDLVSELSRFSWFSAYAERANDNLVTRNGVVPTTTTTRRDYTLHGLLSMAKGRMRLSYRLENGETGIVQWSQTFDRSFSAENILEIQKEAARAVAVNIGDPRGIVRRLEQNRYRQRTEGENAYLCMLKAYHYWDTFDESDHLISRTCLEDAIIKEDHYAEAHAATALMYIDEYRFGFNERSGYDPLKRAYSIAKKAVKLDQFSTLAKQALFTSALFVGRVEEFIQIGRAALKQYPNNPELLADFGAKIAMGAGQWDEGTAYSTKALQLNSFPSRWYFIGPAHRAVFMGDYQLALRWMERVAAPDWFTYNMLRAICFSQLGNGPAAKKSISALGTGDMSATSARIKTLHLFKPLELLLIKRMREAFKYVAGV